MAPRKRKAEQSVKPSKVASSSSLGVTQTSTRRVTRSVIAAAASSSVDLLAAPAKKRASKRKSTGSLNSRTSQTIPEITGVHSNEDPVKNSAPVESEESQDFEKVESSVEVVDNMKTIIIEHCKQCNSFKTRANLVKSCLEESVPNLKVVLNPAKPRKGCFEIRQDGGMKFVSLLDMKRPFKDMKALNMDVVIANIVEKIMS